MQVIVVVIGIITFMISGFLYYSARECEKHDNPVEKVLGLFKVGFFLDIIGAVCAVISFVGGIASLIYIIICAVASIVLGWIIRSLWK